MTTISANSILATSNDENKKGSSSTGNAPTLSSISKPKKIKLPLNEVSPSKKRENHKYEIVDKKQNLPQKKKRRDANGVEINHKNRKKVKVTFKDKLASDNNNNLTEVIKIESFKEYNYVAGLSDMKDVYVKTDCKCECNIF